MTIRTVTVIGAGTMGNGIAHSFAQHGFEVRLADQFEGAAKQGKERILNNLQRQVSKGSILPEEVEKIAARIVLFSGLNGALEGADLVIEAVTETREVKLALFRELSRTCAPGTLLATNTSSISITSLAEATDAPQYVVGMHFMNPVPLMKLVEVIKGKHTSAETMTTIMQLAAALEKIPVEVNDSPGFVANRILMPMINEAIHALHEGVAGVYEIDTVMKLGMAHPMGPLQLADFIGLDVCLAILQVLREGFDDPKYEPCPLLAELVRAGEMGVKSGRGFYTYQAGSKDLVIAPRFVK